MKSNELRVQKLMSSLKGKKVTILGHDNIDVDAALSGMLLSELLDFLQIENRFCIVDSVKENDTYEIMKELFGINIKNWQENKECEDRNLFLLDHYETIHKGQVIGCIDHHLTQQQKSYDFMYVRASCATAYLIYEIMKAVNFPLREKHAKMILVAMLIDTVSFRSSKTIIQEVAEAKTLAEEYKIDFKFLEKYCLCLTEIDKLSLEEIISNGQKWYYYHGNKVGSSYLQLYGLPQDVILKNWLNALMIKRQESCSEMLVFIIFETQNHVTYEYQIMSDCIKEIEHKGILSRGKDIMPFVEKRYFNNMSTEEKIKNVVSKMMTKRQTIATMESCTGGQLASEITNVEGASTVLLESYVSYCNQAKIKFGVPAKVIDEYTVYSAETAIAMAKAVKELAKAHIGVGITGQLGRIDPNNAGVATNNTAWYSIIEKNKQYVSKLYIFENLTRAAKKKIITREILESLYHWN